MNIEIIFICEKLWQNDLMTLERTSRFDFGSYFRFTGVNAVYAMLSATFQNWYYEKLALHFPYFKSKVSLILPCIL